MSFDWPKPAKYKKAECVEDVFFNAITSLTQIDTVLDILQGKKEHTNGDLVAMVLVVAEMEKIANVLEPTR